MVAQLVCTCLEPSVVGSNPTAGIKRFVLGTVELLIFLCLDSLLIDTCAHKLHGCFGIC